MRNSNMTTVMGAATLSVGLLAVSCGLLGCMVGADEDEQPEDDAMECTPDGCKVPLSQAAVGTTYYSHGDTTSGWDTYDSSPAGGAFRVVSDPDRGLVNEFVSEGTHNGFRLRKADLQPWGNSTQFNLEWRQKFDTPFVIYVSVNTSGGHRYLQYTALNKDLLVYGQYILHGLGSSAMDGRWHQFKRDLQADLRDAQPDLTLLSVNAFLIRGSGKLDDIGLSSAASGGSWPVLKSVSHVYSNESFSGIDTVVADGKVLSFSGWTKCCVDSRRRQTMTITLGDGPISFGKARVELSTDVESYDRVTRIDSSRDWTSLIVETYTRANGLTTTSIPLVGMVARGHLNQFNHLGDLNIVSVDSQVAQIADPYFLNRMRFYSSACRVTLDKCPDHPFSQDTFLDEYGMTDQAQCLQLASDYRSWCGSPYSAKAQFEHYGTILAETTAN